MNNSFKPKDDVKTEFHTEPIAWWDGKEPSVLGLSYFKNDYCPIPLYTHPHSDKSVKAKTLTDEEIADFEWAIKNVLNFSQSEKVVGLDNVIRAILRKAQEK